MFGNHRGKTHAATLGKFVREGVGQHKAIHATATATARATATSATFIAHVKGPMPATLEPMMACLTDNPPKGQDWLYEVKWDGIRALCFVEDGELRILSRSGNRCERQYPELTVLPHHVKAASAILDGEIAVLDAKGRSSFSLIQPRISVADPNSIAHLSRSSPVTLFLFDLLYLDGYDLRGVPLEERKALLAEVVEIDEGIRMSDHFVAQGDAMLEAARANGLEGIIGKRRESLYESRRSPNWLKIKVNTEQEFVIGGFTHGERDYFSSLALGLYDKGKFVHVGQVGTGFNDKSLRDIHGKLEPLIIPKSPFAAAGKIPRKVTWVKPELVCNVKYLEFTPDNQLRAPVFLGLRADKDPKECVREVAEPVEKVVQEARTGALLPNDSPNDVALTIDGQALKFTNLNKVFWPGEKITKRDLINYYDAVADLILPHLHDRPLSLKRYPNGIDKPFFFQKNAEQFPDWVRLEPIHSEHSSRDIHYTICNDRATLLFLANLACIDQNPWMSRLSHLENPDFALIDLDPTEGCPYHQIVEAAQLVRAKLELIGLEGCPKTTGGDGMHIYIPLKPVYSYDQVRSFAEILSMLVIHEDPALFTTPRAVSARKKGKVYFDYLQIAASKTISAPYVVRAYPGAPVSTPLAWNEVKKGLEPGDFTIRNAPARFAKKGDVFGGVLANPQRLEAALEKLAGLVAG